MDPISSMKAGTLFIVRLVSMAHSRGQAFLLKGWVHGWVHPLGGVGAGSTSHISASSGVVLFALVSTKQQKSGAIIGLEL